MIVLEEKTFFLGLIAFLAVVAILWIFTSPAPYNITAVECSADPSQGEILLPEPSFSGLTVEDAIAQRRSIRSFSDEDLTLEELSQLLWAGQGITDSESGFRSAPSAGALYPIELYVVPKRVDGAFCGIYHYVSDGHKLILVKEGDYSAAIGAAAYNQEWVGNASAIIIMTAVPSRTTQKYGDAGNKYTQIEAGHIAQNMLLEAVSLGLGATPIGGFSIEGADSVLDIDDREESSVYILIFGNMQN